MGTEQSRSILAGRRSIIMLTAILLAQTVPAQGPSSTLQQADAAYRAGEAALAHHDLNAAQGDFERVVRLAPTAEQGHSALGTVLLNRGQTKAGIHELEIALSIKKTDASAQLNLAIAYEQTGFSAKAIPLFAALDAKTSAAKGALPGPAAAAYARALTSAGRLAPAAVQMKAALATSPQDPELHDQLGSIYAQQKDWPHAQQEFAAAIALEPRLAAAHLHLGVAMQAQGQAEGLGEMLQASQLSPGNAGISLALANAYATAGQDEQATPLFEQVLAQDPASTAAMSGLALVLQRANRVQETIVLLRKVVAAEPDNATALTNLGLALSQAQQAKEAVPVLQRAVKLAPGNATAHQNLAAAYVQLSQLSDATAELQASLRLSPDSPQLHYDLGVAFKMQDDMARAIPELQRAEQLDPSTPEAPYALGVLYMQQARYQDAAREIHRSLNLRPANGDGWAMLGSVYSKLNMLPEAVSALREAIQQLPRQPDPHLTLAAVLAKQSQPAEAALERKTATDLMRANMNRQRAEVATNAGKTLFERGDLPGAVVQFRDALSFDASYVEAHVWLARVLDSQGRAVDAAAERRKAEPSANSGIP